MRWSETWLLKFHPDKCKIMTIHGDSSDTSKFYFNSSEAVTELSETVCEKDIGVMIDNRLKFDLEINNRANKSNQIMGAIRRSFEYLDESNFKLLFKGLVRPHLEYAAPVWMPMFKKDVTTIENVQRRATKCIPSSKDMSYEERLCKLGLPTLRFRRTRGDLIEVSKMFHIYDDEVEDLLDRAAESATRGHAYKLEKKHVRLQIRQHNFKNRVINLWNSLPEGVVSAPTLNTFKNWLDKLWEHHPMKFDWEADESFQPS